MIVERDIVKRWSTTEGVALARKVVNRLARGRTLDDLGLQTIGGKADLRGLTTPGPMATGQTTFGRYDVAQLSGQLTLRGAAIVDMDFSGARLESWRIFDSRIVGCRFDAADTKDWRLWNTRIEDASFIAADMRASSLGPWHEGRTNEFHRVDFSRADLRGAHSAAAQFVDCIFDNAKLKGIDFDSSRFTRCRFAGRLEDVTFWDRGYTSNTPEPNRMEDVDFRNAILDFVDFRGLDLERVKLPSDSNHVIFRQYRCVLRRALERIRSNADVYDVGLAAVIEHELEWSSPRRDVGIFYRQNLGETSAQSEAALRLIRDLERDCIAQESA